MDLSTRGVYALLVLLLLAGLGWGVSAAGPAGAVFALFAWLVLGGSFMCIWERSVVRSAFAHRRKTLANSLALAGVVGRERAVGALAAIGRPPDVRAEALQPEEFVRLDEALAA